MQGILPNRKLQSLKQLDIVDEINFEYNLQSNDLSIWLKSWGPCQVLHMHVKVTLIQEQKCSLEFLQRVVLEEPELCGKALGLR
jgi:hypothetical protein